MKQSINNYDFHRAFETLRPNSFTYDGLNALSEYLEQYEEDTGEEIEFDVIALCCDYSELSFDEIIQNYIYQDQKGYIAVEGNHTLVCNKPLIFDRDLYLELKDADSDDRNGIVLEWLQDRTQVIHVNDDTVIIGEF